MTFGVWPTRESVTHNACRSFLIVKLLGARESVNTPSTEPLLESRLLPRISFRFLLALTALVALLSTLGRWAGDGGALARSILVALAILASVIVIGAVLFLFSWIVAIFTLDSNPPQRLENPFAEGQLPPQTLPPRDRVT